MSRRSKARLRQHANPLSFRRAVPLPRWDELLADPTLPREVDVGCGHGDFLLERARRRPDLNLIGLEIRQGMVERVNRRIGREEVKNAWVVLCNANLSFPELFGPASLERVYVHFPDPWFKKRHHKRRVMTPDFVRQAAEVLRPGGELRFMTDYGEYAAEVVELMAGQEAFENPHGPGRPAPPDPELPATHREAWHGAKGDPIHRYVWRRRP